MHTSRGWSIAAAALAVLAGLFIASPAYAEDPVTFGASPVVDAAGVLGGDLAEVERALQDAGQRSGRQLFVAYVDQFTNPTSAETWANDTAVANNMGDEDYLLAVAVDGRSYSLSVADGASLSDSEIARIRSQVIEPRLSDDDWAGAAIAAADAIAGGGAGTGGGFGWGWILLLLALAAIVVVVLVVVSRRKKKAGQVAGGAAAVPIEDLRRQAGGALVAIDDAVRTSEEELGFAVAAYGDEATAPFREALAMAKGKVAEAFALQQQLDDAVPDTDEQRRAWYGSIIQLTGEADQALDEQAAKFDELRDLERNAPQELERVKLLTASQAEKVAPAADRLAALGAVYAASVLATVADNPAQAQSRLEFATQSADAAAAAIAAGETSDAAVSIRAAEEAADQAGVLAEAIDKLGAALEEADHAVAAGVADLETDVQTAAGLQGAGLAEIAQATAAEAAALRAAGAQVGRDPLALQARLEQANARIDGAVGSAREAAEQAARVAAQLDRSISTARAGVAAAEDYLVNRRGAVGAEARTRLAEAGRLVTLAEQTRVSDPAGALQNAQRAEQLANDAIRVAQQDVGGFGGAFGGQPQQGGGGDVLGAVLGGILINNMLGGGGGGGFGGFGGGSGGGGGFGGFGGGSSSGRRSAAGSFGGSSTRGRRSGGGRF
ncbi:TPM domain-containing protein [Agromyces protaetiae]|uniref:TPM domain-containing protein n=1 Tax=Agromyces protaetiae TaxID=2509455 RepID=UPI001FB7049A|nr:TPM domain-containing protein [Agromyces protaetiae]